MQLKNISGLYPLTIAGGLSIANPAIIYADTDRFSNLSAVISNTIVSDHISEVDEDANDSFLFKIAFDNHLSNWKKRTMFDSSTEKIVQNEDFQAIIAMKEKAVPYIQEELERNPSTLVWALNIILKKNITNNPNITISEACKKWVKLLRTRS